jgi:hypothetical protein
MRHDSRDAYKYERQRPPRRGGRWLRWVGAALLMPVATAILVQVFAPQVVERINCRFLEDCTTPIELIMLRDAEYFLQPDVWDMSVAVSTDGAISPGRCRFWYAPGTSWGEPVEFYLNETDQEEIHDIYVPRLDEESTDYPPDRFVPFKIECERASLDGYLHTLEVEGDI